MLPVTHPKVLRSPNQIRNTLSAAHQICLCLHRRAVCVDMQWLPHACSFKSTPDKTKEAGTYYTIRDTSTFVLWLLQHHLLCHTSFIHSSPIKVSWSTKHFRIFTAKTAAEFSSTTEELMVCYSPSLRDPKIHLKRYHVHPRCVVELVNPLHMGSQFGITLTELYGAIYDV